MFILEILSQSEEIDARLTTEEEKLSRHFKGSSQGMRRSSMR
jgi:hypothetical protein